MGLKANADGSGAIQVGGSDAIVIGTDLSLNMALPIQSLSASVAASALTISTGLLLLSFRSATLTSGATTTASGTPTSLVVPSGATLGTVNAVQSRIIVLALNNAGTIELAVVNIAGGTNLTETGVISTTAISAGATSASVVYSTTARTNVAYRVIGYIESTQATAGAWATAPSTIQGQGGQALTAMSSLGYSQTWQTVTGSRAASTTYYNTTGRPIFVSVGCQNSGGAVFTVNGIQVFQGASTTSVTAGGVCGIVPPSGSYSFSGTIYAFWAELR